MIGRRRQAEPFDRSIPEQSASSDADPANSGIRREPELPEHEAIAPEVNSVDRLFEFPEDEPDDDAARTRSLRDRMRSTARQTALAPG